jgi:RND family efflux transporter MFP subunit
LGRHATAAGERRVLVTPEAAPEVRERLAALRLERDQSPPPRHRSRWPLVAGGMALVLLAVVARRGLGGRPPEVQVVAATMLATTGAAEALVPVLSGAGYVVSAERYIAIGVRVAGRIDHYLAEEGDRVQAGDALVQLDAREYEAAVAHAEATLALSRATANLKRKQLERARPLGQSGVISRDELDVRAAEVDTAEAAVREAEAELAQARVALEYTTLRAPTGGVILAKLKEVGEIAVPGGFSGSGDLIRMANLADLRGQVDVTESEMAKVRMSQPAEVVPDAHPDLRYTAHVVKLYPQVDRQKGTLRVEVQIEQPDQQLWPDMSARITFLERVPATAGRAVLIPRSAVQTEAGGWSAWVVEGERVRRVVLTLGSDFGDRVQVTAGLGGDERVVVGGATALRDGMAVRVAGAGTS